MRGRFLHVPQGHAGVEGSGGERVPQAVGPDWLGDAGPPRDAPNDPRRGVAVQAASIEPLKIGPSSRSPMARSIALG
jgi:hypothetical protein